MTTIFLDGNSLTIPAIDELARQKVRVKLTPAAKRRIVSARLLIDSWVRSDRTVYGVTTGFGEFSNIRIDQKDIGQLQENLILSHAAGAGDPLPPEVVRAMMALRVNALAKGHSGARLETVQMVLDMLERGITPVIPSQGSVGASGDLVQLAHLVLAMMGKGKVWIDVRGPRRQRLADTPAKAIPSSRALARAGPKPVHLEAKEGLALINGTQMMTAFAALANISERRIERLVNGSLSGLPRFLTEQGGLNSGYMIAQYTAASLVSENKVLCHPASVDSIPTSANQEDHNSMGSIGAQKAWRVLKNVQTVLAIEMLCASQGLDFTRKLKGGQTIKAGRGVEAAHRFVRTHIGHLGRDRILHKDIHTALELVRNNAVLHSVERIIGSLDS
jgi:histidine ammonia-lyase